MCPAKPARPRSPGREMIDRIASIMKAMSDPVRLNILYHLQGGELRVGDLVDRLACSQANVSKHLAVLKQSGLVASRSDGPVHYYSIADPMVEEVCNTVCTAVEARINDRRRTAASVRTTPRRTRS